MAQVLLKNLTKKFDEVVAVNTVNLEIRDREFVVLVGPSGCGKTTTLRMVAGLEEITEGDIYIGDRLVNNLASKDRNIAMVFQSYALYPHMKVFDNMAFGLKMRKVPKEGINRVVKQAADLLRIDQLLHRKPSQLSGGQRQRVARSVEREVQRWHQLDAVQVDADAFRVGLTERERAAVQVRQRGLVRRPQQGRSYRAGRDDPRAPEEGPRTRHRLGRSTSAPRARGRDLPDGLRPLPVLQGAGLP